MRPQRQSNGDFAQPTSAINSIGISAITKKLNGQIPEFPVNQYPNTYEVYNRAEKGNVKIWAQAFDSELYPEGATDDRTTWLQPGQTMILTKDAVFHFFGNIFNPTFQGACDVIEACGGFEVEAQGEFVKNFAPARIVGGPLFLPDFIITPKDGRNRTVGLPIAIYDVYDKLTRRLRQNSVLNDQALKQREADLLQSRLAEYRDADSSMFDQYGNPMYIEPVPEPCDCSPIAHAKGVPGCKAVEQEPAAV